VTVTSDDAPTISCPGHMTTGTTADRCDAVVNYNAPTTNNLCDGETVAQNGGKASGSTFLIGTTTNTFEVRDASNNVVGK
jgi:hypothetical protein